MQITCREILHTSNDYTRPLETLAVAGPILNLHMASLWTNYQQEIEDVGVFEDSESYMFSTFMFKVQLHDLPVY